MNQTYSKGKPLQQTWLCIFLKKLTGATDVAENKSWVVVSSFFSNLISAILTIWIALYTYLKFKETVSELVKMLLQALIQRNSFWISKMLLQALSNTPDWIYEKTYKHCKHFDISFDSSMIIFLTTSEYGRFSLNSDSKRVI